jgi:transposase
LQTLAEIRWLTRVPESLSEAKRLLSETAQNQMTELTDGYAYLERSSNCGQIELRWQMVLALLIYALAARQLRLRVSEEGQSLPNPVGKDIQIPTLRWIFQVFEGIDLLIIRRKDQILSRQVLNLRQEHLTVIHLLGPPVENCYLLTS